MQPCTMMCSQTQKIYKIMQKIFKCVKFDGVILPLNKQTNKQTWNMEYVNIFLSVNIFQLQ